MILQLDADNVDSAPTRGLGEKLLIPTSAILNYNQKINNNVIIYYLARCLMLHHDLYKNYSPKAKVWIRA